MIRNLRIMSILIIFMLITVIFIPKDTSSQTIVEILGSVEDIYGIPIKGATIEFYLNEALHATVSTDQRGRFYTAVSEGFYTVVVYAKGYEEKRLGLEIKKGTSRFLNLKFTLDYALIIVPEAGSLVAKQGDRITLGIEASNQGHFVEEYNISIIKPAGWSVNLYTETDIEILSLSIKPHDIRKLKMKVSIPRNVSGDYDLTLLFKGETITVQRFRFRVEERDWHFLDTKYSVITGFRGERVDFDILLKNTLNEPATITLSYVGPAGWFMGFMSEDNKIINAVKLDPETTLNLKFFIDIPESAESNKEYPIKIIGEAEGAKSSLDLTVKVVEGFKRVEVESLEKEVMGYAGSLVQIPLRIMNTGVQPFSVSFEAKFAPISFEYYIMDDQGNHITAVLVQPGKYRDVILSVLINENTSPGIYTGSIRVFSQEISDTAEFTLNIVGVRKIEVLTENYLVSTFPASRVKFALTVMNNGTAVLENVRINILDVPEGIRVVSDKKSVEHLSPGEQVSFVLTIDVDKSVETGVYEIPITIQSGDLKEYRVIIVNIAEKSEVLFYIIVIVIIVVVTIIFVYKRKVTLGKE